VGSRASQVEVHVGQTSGLQPFQRRLHVLLERRSWRAHDLVKAAGVSDATAHRLLHTPGYEPGAKTMLRVARALGLTVEQLLDEGSADGQTPIESFALEAARRVEARFGGQSDDVKRLVVEGAMRRLELYLREQAEMRELLAPVA
jgi:transcriptional regulator with XRE-family HTH domain